MNSLNEKEILETFEKLNISEEKIPPYENPDKFAQRFKICSILEYQNISYSNNSSNI